MYACRTKCVSQDYPEEEISTSDNQIRGRLGRLGRMEQLLETLVAKVSSLEGDEKIMTPESLGSEDILPPESNSTSCNQSIQETAPLLALFDNTAVSIDSFNISVTVINQLLLAWAARNRPVACPDAYLAMYPSKVPFIYAQQDALVGKDPTDAVGAVAITE
jgi:hypothetical protein